MMTRSQPITPVTVIGGFLGAGKTTFLNHLLRTGKSRYAVLVNDFGAVNIDAGLIARHDGATMTLTNGCVCCSIGGGFLETLGAVLDHRIPFDHIVIEASGVGDPWRIAEIALVEPSLHLNAVIVVADASRIATLMIDPRVGDTVCHQFARCDVVLLNKIDLVDRVVAGAAHAAIDSCRDNITIIETSQHEMPDLPLAKQEFASGFRATEAGDASDHERLFRRWSYRRDGAFDRARFEVSLRQLPSQLLRLKGRCDFAGESEAHLLQMVGPGWSLTATAAQQLPASSGILLAGVGTDDLPETTELDAILDRALASPTDAHSIRTTSDNNGGHQPPTLHFHS